ncbi:hypothetical protein NDU88_006193 [Pleurodeles waltl]|uniref:Uncharacterized protein n=1 Tax=Pleurodeles waltl TaxID=8319 RepID=A0AAV7NPK4_PLEWA|nr:hypothetical protein NDU88_006193 [Pleurodeles waltl]
MGRAIRQQRSAPDPPARGRRTCSAVVSALRYERQQNQEARVNMGDPSFVSPPPCEAIWVPAAAPWLVLPYTPPDPMQRPVTLQSSGGPTIIRWPGEPSNVQGNENCWRQGPPDPLNPQRPSCAVAHHTSLAFMPNEASGSGQGLWHLFSWS